MDHDTKPVVLATYGMGTQRRIVRCYQTYIMEALERDAMGEFSWVTTGSVVISNTGDDMREGDPKVLLLALIRGISDSTLDLFEGYTDS